MRVVSLLALMVFPATLVAQFPEAGRYKGNAVPAGADNEIPLILTVKTLGDSVALEFGVENQQPIPLSEQMKITGGFQIAFGNLTCPFVVANDQWESICVDMFDNPVITVHFPRRPEPVANP